MAVTNIPNFKEVIVMSFVCDFCGVKSNEIRGGGAMSEYGTETRLLVSSLADLSRDVVKSASATIKIPELGLEMGEGTLGG